MKHSPIIFSTPMVKSILGESKTQTRRMLGNFYKNQTPEHEKSFNEILEYGKDYLFYQCPYGKKGDLLWVRETFDPTGCLGSILYKADYSELDLKNCAHGVFKWKPSIHMPKLAARLWLQIVDVRIEKLNSISAVDAMYEGVKLTPDGLYKNYLNTEPKGFDCPVESFNSLWQSIHGKHSFMENPWVWVITFKKIAKPVIKNISPEDWQNLKEDDYKNPSVIYRVCVENNSKN